MSLNQQAYQNRALRTIQNVRLSLHTPPDPNLTPPTQELEFLAEVHVISHTQLSQILMLLPNPSSAAVSALRTQTPALQAPAQSSTPAVPHNLGFTPPMSPPAATKTPAHEKAMLPIAGPAQPPPPSYTPTALVLSRAEAMWAFSGSEAGDLSFAAGDVVEVIEKVKDDWWRGRVVGQSEVGLFPSSYVKEMQVLAVGNKVPGLPERKTGYGGYGQGGNMMTEVAHAGPSNGYEQQQQQGQGEEKKKGALGKNGEKFGKKLGNGLCSFSVTGVG